MSHQTNTNANGEYTLIVPLGDYNLIVSNIGYDTHEELISFTTSGEYSLDISLEKGGEGMEHTWEKEVVISMSNIDGDITVSGTPEINYEQTIVASIQNNRDTDVVGIVTVEILKDGIVIGTLEPNLPVTILATGAWSETYTWIPTEVGTYRIRLTLGEEI